MPARFQAAGEIDRQAAAARGLALPRHAPALARSGEAHGLVFDHLGHGEAVMRLDQIKIVDDDARLLLRLAPGPAHALERDRVAHRQGQHVVDMAAGAEGDRAVQRQRRFGIGHHQSRRAVRHQRAIGAAQRAGHQRVLVGNSVAEVEAEILAHVGIGVAHAVDVVFGRDHRQLFAAVAVALEIGLRDAPENAGKACVALLLLAVAGGQQNVAHLRVGRRRHLLRADDERDASAPRLDEIQRAVERGAAGGASVLVMGGGDVRQFRHGRRHQRAFKSLPRKTVVEDADRDGIDIAGRDAGMGQRLARDPAHQALDVRVFQLAEGCMRPPDDRRAFCHSTSLPLPFSH